MHRYPPAPRATDDDALQNLLDAAAGRLVDNPDSGAFLDWIAAEGPHIAPAIADHVDPRSGPVGQAFRALGVEIYNAMPLPTAGFRPRKLALPGRNAPCLCGSGRKYKQCCLPLAGMLELEQFNLLRYVLDQMPEGEFAALVQTRVDTMAVVDTAAQWHDEDKLERAAALLEPWFAGEEPLTAAIEPLFDELMEIYATLDDEAACEDLARSVIARGEPTLRSAALQRQSAMRSDRGDRAGAWEDFKAAQRADPDSPGLATLEMTLLVLQNDFEQARSRARFWITRFERLHDPLLADLLDFLYDAELDPQAALHRLDRGAEILADVPELAELESLFEQAPPATAAYAIRAHGEAGDELVADEPLQQVEQRWRQAYLQPKPLATSLAAESDEMWDEAEGWLRVLARHPLAWQSFDVLDDIVLAVAALPPSAASDALLDKLLQRGLDLIDCNCAAALASATPLPWTWIKNRPALRVLAQATLSPLGPGDADHLERFLARAEQLLALNPADQHGIREPLTRVWLERGRATDVIVLTERFADDFCAPSLNRLLALYRLGDTAAAAAFLEHIGSRHGAAIDMLLAERAPRRPRADPHSGRFDEALDDAWIYRDSCRALWLADGALDWLRVAWNARPA